MYGYRFLGRGSMDRNEILHDGLATSHTGFLFSGIAPEMAEFWAPTGAIWRDMLQNAAARLIFAARRRDHISPLLQSSLVAGR